MKNPTVFLSSREKNAVPAMKLRFSALIMAR
jgi:hypothetical protein